MVERAHKGAEGSPSVSDGVDSRGCWEPASVRWRLRESVVAGTAEQAGKGVAVAATVLLAGAAGGPWEVDAPFVRFSMHFCKAARTVSGMSTSFEPFILVWYRERGAEVLELDVKG